MREFQDKASRNSSKKQFNMGKNWGKPEDMQKNPYF